MEKPIFIGLMDVVNPNVTEPKELDLGQTIICDSTIVTEYKKAVNRPITQIYIGTQGNPHYLVKALWDTGSTTSCISKRFASKMGIQPINTGVGLSASEKFDISYYLLNLYMSNELVIENVKVAEFPIRHHDVDFLIGMDVISKGDFSIINKNGKMKLTFELTK